MKGKIRTRCISYIKGLRSLTPVKQLHSKLATKVKNWEKGDTHEVRRGFIFPTDFPKNSSWDIQTHRWTKVVKHCACAVK